jgi:hypothetical protein
LLQAWAGDWIAPFAELLRCLEMRFHGVKLRKVAMPPLVPGSAR